MKKTNKCLKCSGETLEKKTVVMKTGTTGRDKHFEAIICKECGYTELYKNSNEIY